MEIQITTPEELFAEKTRELCQTIVDRPDFKDLCTKIDAFMCDEKAKFEMQMLNDLGAILSQKQQYGAEISEEEAGRFEALRDNLTANPVATQFMAAQEIVQRLQDDLLKHIQKTFELGKVPTKADMDDGSCCGGTCGYGDEESGQS